MTIESSGIISLGTTAGTNRSITAEFGGVTPHNLSEYYNNGSAGVDIPDPIAHAEYQTPTSSGSFTQTGTDGSTARTVVVASTGIGHDSNTGWLTDATNGVETDTTEAGQMNFTNDSGATDYFESPTADPDEQPWGGRYYYSYDQASGIDQNLSYMVRVETSNDGDYHWARWFMGHYRCDTTLISRPNHYTTVNTSSFQDENHSYTKAKVKKVEWESDFFYAVGNSNGVQEVDEDDVYADIIFFNSGNDSRTEVALRIDRTINGNSVGSTVVNSIIACVVEDSSGAQWRFERGTEEAGDGPSNTDQYSMRHRRVPEYSITSQSAGTGWSNNTVTMSNSYTGTLSFPEQNRSGYAAVPSSGEIKLSDFYGLEKITAWTSTLTTGNTQGQFCFKSCSYWPMYGFMRYQTYTQSGQTYVRAIPATNLTSTFTSTEGSMTDTTFDKKTGSPLILGLYWDESLLGTGSVFFSIAGHHTTGDLQSITIGSTTLNFAGANFTRTEDYQDSLFSSGTTYPYTKFQWSGQSNPFPTTEGSTVSISVL